VTRPDPDLVKRADDALAPLRAIWLAEPDVVSVEVARRWVDNVVTDEIGIRVTVLPRKPGESRRSPTFPTHLDGVPVEVVHGRPPTLDH